MLDGQNSVYRRKFEEKIQKHSQVTNTAWKTKFLRSYKQSSYFKFAKNTIFSSFECFKISYGNGSEMILNKIYN